MSQNPNPEKVEDQLERHMNTGLDEEDKYWRLFQCKDAVNTAIVEAYKLGYKRGYIDGMEYER